MATAKAISQIDRLCIEARLLPYEKYFLLQSCGLPIPSILAAQCQHAHLIKRDNDPLVKIYPNTVTQEEFLRTALEKIKKVEKKWTQAVAAAKK